MTEFDPKHVFKVNLTVKRLFIERLIYAACRSFNLLPSELIVVDLCSSHAKELMGLMQCGILYQNYFGFDADRASVEKAKEVVLETVQHIDPADAVLVHCVDLLHRDAREKHMSTVMKGRRAHIVLCNFALHVFVPELEDTMRWLRESSSIEPGFFFSASYLSGDELLKAHSSDLVIANIATYSVTKCQTRVSVKIEGGKFANNGEEENIIRWEHVDKAMTAAGMMCILHPTPHTHYFNHINQTVQLSSDVEVLYPMHEFCQLHTTAMWKMVH